MLAASGPTGLLLLLLLLQRMLRWPLGAKESSIDPSRRSVNAHVRSAEHVAIVPGR